MTLNMPASGHGFSDSRNCVKHSAAETQPEKKRATTYSPAEIYEIVQEQIRMVEVENAVYVLKKHGWHWECFDPGRSGLVPGYRKQGL